MKKFIVVILLAILVVVIALLAPPITSKSLTTPTPIPQAAGNIPTPRPTPFLKIDKNSNLSQESQKLNVPDYQDDFAALDQTLSQF